ncbi:hypothetical protein PHYBOEH_010552 [Phytophthora boehmeriae]|uniref:M96 mating-specific protein family n=1 Tax=Phytophthora boehmeriae TaxID=109152 RepID=A0A8T1VMW8_9STRA|nr:hypothetical protein PHYBOEH_010552 [Phytophthora boehmeriae]
MEIAPTSDLDASLELLDDVEGFDLVIPELDNVHEGDSVAADSQLDEDQPLLQLLEVDKSILDEPYKDQDKQVDIITATMSTTSSDKSQVVPVKSTRKARHQRKKKELEYLKAQVAELEQQLQGLKNANNIGDNSQTILLWERAAKNQREELMKAEIENVKLRETLEGQLKIAKSLEKLLRKRPADEVFDSRHQKFQVKLTSLRQSEIFNILSDRIDDQFGCVDAVMKDAGFATLKCERNGAQVKLDESSRLYVEMVDAKISPFPVHKVAEAVWTTLTTQRIALTNGYFEALECTDDTMRAEFCVSLPLRRTEVLIRVNILGKRVVEEHRVVLIWATMGQIEGAAFNTQCMNLSESGWTLIEELGDESSAPGGGTIIETCVHLIPEFDDLLEQRSQVGVLTDVIIGSYALNMQRLHQTIENQLFKDEIVCDYEAGKENTR